jgi:hypothetical protein
MSCIFCSTVTIVLMLNLIDSTVSLLYICLYSIHIILERLHFIRKQIHRRMHVKLTIRIVRLYDFVIHRQIIPMESVITEQTDYIVHSLIYFNFSATGHSYVLVPIQKIFVCDCNTRKKQITRHLWPSMLYLFTCVYIFTHFFSWNFVCGEEHDNLSFLLLVHTIHGRQTWKVMRNVVNDCKAVN